MKELTILLYTLAGTGIGALFCVIPALHIYNVAGIAVVIWLGAKNLIPYYALAPFFMSLVVAFSFINIIPMTIFGTLDESAGATILPTNELVARGRGKDAVLLTGTGTFAGMILLAALYPFFWYIWPYIAAATGPHLHWILGLVIVHYIMSEWPKGAGRGPTVWRRFSEAWRNCFAGLATFSLAGIFGVIYLSKPVIPASMSFQNIMPVFIGFFAIPSLIQGLVSYHSIPHQYDSNYVNADWKDMAYGLLPGFFGGLTAAYLPGVTAGIGAMLAGHATNHRNLQRIEMIPSDEEGKIIDVVVPEMYYRQERNFLIAGGVIKIIYYVGAFLLLFVLTDLTPFGTGRGGLTFILKPVFTAERGDYLILIGSILLSGSLSFLILISFTGKLLRSLKRINYKYVFIFSLVSVFAIIYFMAGGLRGVGVSLITTCIGMIPVFYGCRRSHCMAVLLVPIALNMAGHGDALIRILGLG